MMQHPYTILALIILTGCLTGISSDIYAPSLVVISDYFTVDLNLVQSSMAVFMIGISASQLLYGPLSEGFGRKKVLILGLSIMLIGTTVCYLSTSIEMLIAGRLVQGFGAGAGSSLWRAIFKDSFSEKQAALYAPILTIIATFVIPAAPTLGALLETTFGWRSTFLFLMAYGGIAILYLWLFVQETHQTASLDKLKLTYIKASYKELLSSPIFMGYALCIFICFGAFFSWLIVGPVLVIKNLGYTQYNFGFITLLGGVGMALSGYTSRRLVPTKGFQFTLQLGWILMMISGLFMLGGAYLFPSNIIAVAAPIFIFYYGVTFVWPAAFTRAFNPFGHIAGYAGSLYSFLQMGGAGIIGIFVSYLPDHDQKPLAAVMILAPIVAMIAYRTVIVKAEQNLKDMSP